MVETLGFVGLGRMGRPISRRLIEAGYTLVVHDRDQGAVDALASLGAEVAPDPAAVADRSDIVFVSLPTPAIVRDVALGSQGVIEGSRARHLVDLSTTGIPIAREIAGAFEARGKVFVDCPVTGGVAGAQNGVLTMIVGASDEGYAAVRPVLAVIGNNLVHAGRRPGDGQMLKVINNLLSFVALEVTAEAMALGVRYGLDPEAMLNTFNNGTGRNSATEDKFPRSVMPRSFDFGFPVRGVNKDIGLCLAEAESLNVPMPVSRAAQQVWSMAMAEMADDDMTSIIKMFERWASVEVRGRHA